MGHTGCTSHTIDQGIKSGQARLKAGTLDEAES